MNVCRVILCLFFGVIASADDGHFSMRNATCIQKRYYLIRRLESPVAILLKLFKIQHANGVELAVKKTDLPIVFEDPLIQEAALQLFSTNTISSFNKVWGNFLSYKRLDDPNFVRETLLFIVLFYKKILLDITKMHKDVDIDPLIDSIDTYFKNFGDEKKERTIEASLAVIGHAEFIGQKKAIQYQLEVTALLTGHHTLNFDYNAPDCDLKEGLGSIMTILDEASTEESCIINNNMRFYHIQRMLHSMFILSHCRYRVRSLDDSLERIFTHPRVRSCFEGIQKNGNLESLRGLWKSFASYGHMGDKLLLEEFIKLIIVVYGHLEIIDCHQRVIRFDQAARQSTLGEMISLYETMNQLPIVQLLNLLDDVVGQYDNFSQQYELNNTELTWQDWIIKYWWVPPVMATSVTFTLLKYAYNLGFFKKA